MKNTELLQNAIGMIGDDLIDDADRKLRRPIVMRWSAVACACLAVTICLIALFHNPTTPIDPWIPPDGPVVPPDGPVVPPDGPDVPPDGPDLPPDGPDLPTDRPWNPWIPTGEAWQPALGDGVQQLVLTGNEIEKAFYSLGMGGTNAYQEVCAPNVQALASFPIPQAEFLPVYRIQDRNGNRAALEAFIYKYTNAANDLYGLAASEYIVKEKNLSHLYRTVSYIAELEQEDGEVLVFESSENELRFYYDLHYNDDYSYTGVIPSVIEDPRFQLNGEFVSVLEEDTDEQMKEKLSGLIMHINQTLGKEYSDIKVIKRYDLEQFYCVSIYLYNEENLAGGEFPDNFNDAPVCSEYIELEFRVTRKKDIPYWYNWEGEKNEAFLTVITYVESLNNWKDYYSVTGKARMLSLEEAEELLAKGYVFGGHGCSVCMAGQPKVDFTEYDAVSFEYVYGYQNIVVPFYTFYKHIGASKYDKTGRMQEYAKTYVPAVEIEGLEEYFHMKEHVHE